jgi:hypothetical protein
VRFGIDLCRLLRRERLMRVEELATIVDELVEILHLQTRELEKLIAHVGQVTVHLPEESEMSVIRSGLSALHLRLKKLRGVEHPLP